MAKIQTDTIIIEVSKLFKQNDDQQSVLSESQLAMLTEVIEATVAELVADPSLVIEVKI